MILASLEKKTHQADLSVSVPLQMQTFMAYCTFFFVEFT